MSPTYLSPITKSKSCDNEFPGVSQPRYSNNLPLQRSVGSASPMPSSPALVSQPSQIASPRYIQQYRSLLDRQRQVFDEERALWHIEREELQEKITYLEASLRRYRALSTSEVASPSFGPFGGFSPLDNSRTSGSTGDEFWRGPGGKSNAQPTRTFSESSSQSIFEERHMPSIPEVETPGKVREGAMVSTVSHRPSVDILKTDKDLDGITFKSPPSISESVASPPSPSPLTSPPSKREGPKFVPLAPEKHDPYTKDAGHTPLVRRSSGNSDGNASSVGDVATPTQDRESQQAPIKTPSERSKSYFPPSDELEEDVGLKGPLSLKNSSEGDKDFLSELDSKLLQAAISAVRSPPESDSVDEKENESPGNRKEIDGEPKLRIKRSMNFGSQFGSGRCGKGV